MSRTHFAFIIFALMVCAAIFAPLLTSHSPNEFSLNHRFAEPSWQTPFGRDQNGADVLAQVLYGARISLGVSIAVVTVCSLLGTAIGAYCGFFGGWADLLIMRFIEMLQAFPGFLLALSLVAVMGPSFKNLIIALSITGWTGYARLVRGEVLHIKNKDFVVSAEAIGARPMRILLRHILPHVSGPLLVQATLGFAGVILAESGLSFLGLGVSIETPTWGALLNNGRRFLSEAPHMSFFPGLAIFSFVICLQTLGTELRKKI